MSLLVLHTFSINPLSANPQNGQTHSNKTNCLSVFQYFVGLAPKGVIALTRFSRFFGLIHAPFIFYDSCFFIHHVLIRISKIWQIGAISKFLLSSICLQSKEFTLHKKWSFPLRISSVNVTKSAGKCNGKLIFSVVFQMICCIGWSP